MKKINTFSETAVGEIKNSTDKPKVQSCNLSLNHGWEDTHPRYWLTKICLHCRGFIGLSSSLEIKRN